MGPLQRKVLRVLYAAKVHLGIRNLSSQQIADVITDAYGAKCYASSVAGAISGMGRQANRHWVRENRVYDLNRPIRIGRRTVHRFDRRWELTERGERALVRLNQFRRMERRG